MATPEHAVETFEQIAVRKPARPDVHFAHAATATL